MKMRTLIAAGAILLAPVIAAAQTDTSPPTVPTGLAAVATYNMLPGSVGYDGMQVSWNASSDNGGVLGYKVKRALASSGATSSLPDSAELVSTSNTSFWDSSALGHTQYIYTVAAYDADGNISAQTAIIVMTPYGKGARVKINADVSVGTLSKNGKMQKNGKDTQPKGALGTIVNGPLTIDASNPKNVATYYQIDFDSGVDGYVESANVIGSEMAIASGPGMTIAQMQEILSKLEMQLRTILAKIEELRTALTAAAAVSQ